MAPADIARTFTASGKFKHQSPQPQAGVHDVFALLQGHVLHVPADLQRHFFDIFKYDVQQEETEERRERRK